ncbi:bifunctional DNA primase/polymerase [Rhodobacter sp. CZR27]|uniref:bifunctional DNA primase/polymerase n=1 Tax=Rhodobacter sp. CZR27 TaxID=2033869 RepID=UPI0012FE553C|nr:bifunctional DNA primase/polymerase [Rhodobacter sp. CZR27]
MTWADTIELRARLHGNGWRIVPVDEKSKGPLFAAWPSFQYDPSRPEPIIPRTRNAQGAPTALPHAGTGAITSGFVGVDIDIDDPSRADAARRAFEMVAESAVIVRQRQGSARRMLFYGAGEGVEGLSRSIGDDAAKVEIFANHPGRQVMIHGRHPSGAVLEYEGDAPEDWNVADLPRLDWATLNAAFKAALEAAGIRIDGSVDRNAESVRGLRADDEIREALGERLHRIFSGASVHRASKEAADMLAHKLGLDGDQTAAVLAAVAIAARAVSPAHGERYDEMLRKADSRGGWYASRAAAQPTDPDAYGYWAVQRMNAMKRAWRLLPAGLQKQFLEAARDAEAAAKGGTV